MELVCVAEFWGKVELGLEIPWERSVQDVAQHVRVEAVVEVEGDAAARGQSASLSIQLMVEGLQLEASFEEVFAQLLAGYCV